MLLGMNATSNTKTMKNRLSFQINSNHSEINSKKVVTPPPVKRLRNLALLVVVPILGIIVLLPIPIRQCFVVLYFKTKGLNFGYSSEYTNPNPKGEMKASHSNGGCLLGTSIPTNLLLKRDDVCHALAESCSNSINLNNFLCGKSKSGMELNTNSDDFRVVIRQRQITRPKGLAEDIFVKVGNFHFPTDFVVVDFEAILRVSSHTAIEVPMYIEEGYYDLEGDVLYLESLLSEDTTHKLSPEVFFDHEPQQLRNEPENEPLITFSPKSDPLHHEFTGELITILH
ncbi:hypothetical protein Tco_1123797 [Tanacetum coccineum]|uniref:Uncharacterized protein n=1 Tax=Tanacetum coccineum TaxID=301880 RepID=A0ABQ5J778_9ASTR